MRHASRTALATAILSFATLADAAPSLQMLGSVLPTDISQDGSVVVGNLPGSFETFRWTSSTGVVPLGRPTVPTLNLGAGSPDISWDGKRISATILSDSGTQAVAGVWSDGPGWQVLSPLPPNAVPSGADAASAWGMSGDGSSVVGLYWVANSRAHAFKWTSATGMVDLGSVPNNSSRANDASYDGSVVVGWDAAPSGFPGRTPTVWVNGVKTRLGVGVVDSELRSVNAAGTVVGGSWRDGADPVRGAAIWRFDGSNWNLRKIGVLPGTAPDTPGAVVDAMSADGSIVVGFNRFDTSSQFNATGFYWSEATGMISAAQLLENLQLTLPTNVQVVELTSITPDGSTIAGIGFDGSVYQSFLITVPEPGTALIFCSALPALIRRRRH